MSPGFPLGVLLMMHPEPKRAVMQRVEIKTRECAVMWSSLVGQLPIRVGALYGTRWSLFREIRQPPEYTGCFLLCQSRDATRFRMLASINYVDVLKSASGVELMVLVVLAGASAYSWALITMKSMQLRKARAES